MAGLQWARLQTDVHCSLRRGAWYRVTAIDGLEVPSFLLKIASTPPRSWTVVPTPPGATRAAAASLGPQYAVCPSCRERTPLPLKGRPRTLDCARCRGVFEVAWNEGYLR